MVHGPPATCEWHLLNVQCIFTYFFSQSLKICVEKNPTYLLIKKHNIGWSKNECSGWFAMETLKLIFRKFIVSFPKSPFLPSRRWIWSLYDWQQLPTSQLESLDSHLSFFSHQNKKHIQSHQWPRGTHYLMFPNDANETCWVHSGFQRLSIWPWWLELIKNWLQGAFVFKCLQIFAVRDETKTARVARVAFVCQLKCASHRWTLGD